MDITKIDIRILNDDRNGFSHFKTVHPGQLVPTDAELERLAHVYAAQELNRRFPGQWCYRYGNWREDVRADSPGVITNYRYGDGMGIDGVTDMNLIADDGFRGQFQWIDGGLGGYVPATVDITNPVKEAEYERRQAEYRAEEARKQQALTEKLSSLPGVRFVDGGAELWQSWVDANQDGYGQAVMIYAEQWARLMQAELRPEFLEATSITTNDDFVSGVRAAFAEIANRTSHEADTVGLTGFQYGVAVNILTQSWIYGEELRRWHNKEWGAPDAKGTVNPAILNIE